MSRPRPPAGGNSGHSGGNDGGGNDGGDGNGGRPGGHGGGGNAQGISSSQRGIGRAVQQGDPDGGTAPGTPTRPPRPPRPAPPPQPSAPPAPDTIRHTDASREHIVGGDGGSQGGHLAGTGLPGKTEFPPDWDEARILDAAHEVTQTGQMTKGPFLTKDVDGNPVWAYNYEGVVDGGVLVRTTVLADGEIRTAFPPNAGDPGVIINPSAPTPAPAGVPQGNPPRYSHPDTGGDGSWTWEGPKGNKVIRVVQDAEGNITKTELGDYRKPR